MMMSVLMNRFLDCCMFPSVWLIYGLPEHIASLTGMSALSSSQN